MSNLCKSLYLLKLTSIYKLKLAKFLFALHNNGLLKNFYVLLTKLESVHDHNTRQKTKMFILSPQFYRFRAEIIVCSALNLSFVKTKINLIDRLVKR